MGKPQIISTETGERLVVLTEREYDALLARGGDRAAEDRMTARIAKESRDAIARGEEVVFPGWFADAVIRDGSAIRGARKHRGKTQAEIAGAAGITQGYFSDVERGAKVPTLQILDAISDALDLDRTWLRELEQGRTAGT